MVGKVTLGLAECNGSRFIYTATWVDCLETGTDMNCVSLAS